MSEAPPSARREERVRLWMIGVFTLAFVGVLLVYMIVAIFDVPLRPDNFTNSYSTSPAGHSALVDLLRDAGREVKTSNGALRAPEDQGDATETLVLLEPRYEFVEQFESEFTATFTYAREEHTSVVLVMPKRSYELAAEQPDDGEVLLWETLQPMSVVRGVHERTGFDKWFGLRRVNRTATVSWYDGSASVTVDEPVQVFDIHQWPEELEVLADTGDGDPVVMRWLVDEWRDRGGVILVSDPDFLSNRFISRVGAGEFSMKIFRQTPRTGTVLIDEDLHGFSADPSIEYLAATPPGLWVTLSAMMALLIFGWRQATVLRPQAAEVQDRRARKYAIEGLARMMERAGDHDTAARRVMQRARFVLGKGGAQVQGAGATGMLKKGKTGRVTRIQGASSIERLVTAAQRVSHLKRTGETEHGDWE